MRRTVRGLTAALAALALALATVVTTTTPARANAEGFILNSSSFGPNATIMIEIGALTRGCDFIYTASDIYVVPAGFTGGALSDVSGTPNTVQSAMMGSGVIDEIIGFTGPSGTIGEGSYDIVEDVCQDGQFDPGVDSILSNAFTVSFPSGVPPLPSQAIANMKNAAQQQQGHWEDAERAFNAMMSAYIGYEMISGLADPVSFYLTYVCMGMPNPNPDMPVTPWCPTVGLGDIARLKLGVSKTMLDKANHYKGIAADPPDHDYVGPSLPEARDTFVSVRGNTTETALVTFMDSVAQDEALAGAYLGAMEKYQGAQIDDEPAVALMHARAMQTYAIALRDLQTAQNTNLNNFRTQLNRYGNTETKVTEIRNAQTRLAADGFTAAEERELRNLGMDDAALAALREAFVNDLDVTHPFPNFTDMANSMVDANNAMGAAWVQIHNDLNPVIAQLEDVVAAGGGAAYPVVDARGSYSARLPATPTLTATCADCTSFAWDLDGDGEYDDATGNPITPTMPLGVHTVGVLGTNGAGLTSTDTARVTITTANRAPEHTAKSPNLGTVEVAIGASQEFTVTVRDYDTADTPVTNWSVDGVDAGAGTSATVTATDGAPAVVTAVTTDDSGAFATTSWRFIGAHPDADGDGWHANVDCDDTSAAVNPGAAEIPGNGTDDDCNPATPDTGPPTAAFDWAPSPAIVGEEVAFTDASTDPDGPVAGWAWDFGGGTTATEQNPTHTFTSTGTHPVSLVVVDDDGLSGSTTADVVVTDRPVASFTFSPATPNSGDEVTFTSTSTDAEGIDALEWDFSYDGVTFNGESTDASPTHTFPTGATVALRVTDPHGAVSELVSQEIPITGPPVAAFNPRPANGGTNMALVPHGANIASFSSAASTTYAAVEMIDVDYPSGETPWRTATGLNTNQWAVVDLGAQYLVDRIKVKPISSTSYRPAQVGFSLSTTGAGSGFTAAFAGELANDGNLQELELATPVEGRWLRYDAFTNRGGAYIGTDRVEAWTGQVGDATVTFQDLSTDPDGAADIVAWAWDFGDGASSTEAAPTHTYAGPGVYSVTLTVTDSTGNTATRTLPQTVIQAAVTTDFNLPANPREGASATFTNASTVPSYAAVVNRAWTFGDGGVANGSLNASRVYTDNGTYAVTLTETDSYGFTTTVTKQVEVANQPPTIGLSASYAGWVDEVLPFNNFSISDPGSVDRSSLKCTLDRGDGSAVVEVENCTNAGIRLPYAYTTAGTYTLSLKVEDKDGGELERTATVTVSKRGTHVVVHAIPGTARGGGIDVRAIVLDTVDWTPVEGAVVTLDVDGETTTRISDAGGEVTARMPFVGPEGEFTASVAETRLSLPTTNTTLLTSTQRPPGDVYFVVDESGSMGSYQARMRENLVSISEQLAASLDHQIGIAGMPTSAHGLFVKTPPTNHLDTVVAAANSLNTSNGGELGIDAVVMASQPSAGWRPGVGKCLVLIGDEPAQRRSGTTDQMAHDALADSGVVLYSIININNQTLPYQELATESGGAFFNINEFRDDPEPVLEVLLDNCASSIVERPDLNLSIDDGVTEVTEGDTVTYTVTIGNSGPVDSTGVAATATLPAGLAFVSASDGGTHDAGTVTWPTFTLAGESSVTRTVTVEVTGAPGGTVTMKAAVTDDGAGGDDVTPGNNSDSDTDNIVAAPTPTPTPTEEPTPDVTVTATATATATATTTVTPTVTTSPTVTTTETATATATATATTTATTTSTATATHTAKPAPAPTVTTTKTAKPKPQDLYESPGYHDVGGRKWMTVCEPYSVTHRCWTYIWGTQIKGAPGAYHKVNGWVFNNLTYLASPRSLWVDNPLGNTGAWVDEEGRGWRTECETAVSGRNGCRSYVTTKVLAGTPEGIRYVEAERFNNIVRFTIN